MACGVKNGPKIYNENICVIVESFSCGGGGGGGPCPRLNHAEGIDLATLGGCDAHLGAALFSRKNKAPSLNPKLCRN